MSAELPVPEPGTPEPLVPEPAAPEPGEEAPAKRGPIARLGKKRLAIIAFLAVLLAGSVGLWSLYLTTRQPIAKLLPPAQSVLATTLQPRYLFSINGITEPHGVAVTPEGDRIYVVEGQGERMVRAFDRDGRELAAFAAPGTEANGRLPLYVAVDNAGLVYVVDRMRSSIDVFDAGGNHKSTISSPFPEAWFPLGIQVDGDDLLVTDVTRGKHRVLRLSKDGTLVSQFGAEGQEVGQLAYPQAVATDARGRIYVSDGNNARVQAFDKSGNVLFVLTGFNLPRGVEVDGYQRLHVVDTIGQKVSVLDVSKDEAQLMFDFGDIGIGDGLFSFPNCIAVDDTDRLYITDRMNNRVQVWVY